MLVHRKNGLELRLVPHRHPPGLPSDSQPVFGRGGGGGVECTGELPKKKRCFLPPREGCSEVAWQRQRKKIPDKKEDTMRQDTKDTIRYDNATRTTIRDKIG